MHEFMSKICSFSLFGHPSPIPYFYTYTKLTACIILRNWFGSWHTSKSSPWLYLTIIAFTCILGKMLKQLPSSYLPANMVNQKRYHTPEGSGVRLHLQISKRDKDSGTHHISIEFTSLMAAKKQRIWSEFAMSTR